MSDLNINLNRCKSTILLSKKKNSVNILKYINNNDLFFPKSNKIKDNNSLISNLLNSSKKLIKNNLRYKSCTGLPKKFQYIYPYKPNHPSRNFSAKINSKTNSDIYLFSTFKTLNLSKKYTSNLKKEPKEEKK